MTWRILGVVLLTLLLCWCCQNNKSHPAEEEAQAKAEASQEIELVDEQPLAHPTIHDAVNEDDLADVKRHLARGTAVDIKGLTDCTPLHYAAMGGHIDIAVFLIDQGADVNAKTTVITRGLITPLHFAAMNGHKDVAELLIDSGADVDAKTSDGDTPLIYAAMGSIELNPTVDVVELLIARGADVNAKDNSGYTPLSVAAKAGHHDIIELLRKHGARE
jgi:ankyrin repeat protein